MLPSGATHNYTFIEISLFAGRSIAAKSDLYKKVFGSLGAAGVAPTDVLVVLIESPMENWGIRGGVPASEVDVGFRVDI